MEYRFPLGERGTLRVIERGPRAVVEARLPDDGRGLYKACLTGAGGRVLLGTLIPQAGGVLTLRRTLSLDQLRRQGAWPPTGGEAVLSFTPQAQGVPPPGWRWVPPPLDRVSDPPLRRALGELRRVLLRREGEGFALALPWTAGCPVPLTPLFCLARPRTWGGRGWLVFSFDGEGWPRLGVDEPPPEGYNGENHL